MHKQWSCPDDSPAERDYPLPVPGSDEGFPDCPAYYLRTADMGMPAEHLIDGVVHPGQLVSEWASEIQNGARMVDSVSPKARELVHLWLRERDKAQEHDRKKREANRAR